jgi:hypothetical protein
VRWYDYYQDKTMSWIMVDIEADGPIPGDYSMVSFGAVVVEPGLERSFLCDLVFQSGRPG